MEPASNQPPQFTPDELTMPTSAVVRETDEHHSRVGLLLVLLIVLLVLILGGLYLWYSAAFAPSSTPQPTTERFVPEMPNEPEMANADAEVQQLNTVSTSNEVDAIEADIESTDLEELDAELNAIDAEMNTVF